MVLDHDSDIMHVLLKLLYDQPNDTNIIYDCPLMHATVHTVAGQLGMVDFAKPIEDQITMSLVRASHNPAWYRPIQAVDPVVGAHDSIIKVREAIAGTYGRRDDAIKLAARWWLVNFRNTIFATDPDYKSYLQKHPSLPADLALDASHHKEGTRLVGNSYS